MNYRCVCVCKQVYGMRVSSCVWESMLLCVGGVEGGWLRAQRRFVRHNADHLCVCGYLCVWACVWVSEGADVCVGACVYGCFGVAWVCKSAASLRASHHWLLVCMCVCVCGWVCTYVCVCVYVCVRVCVRGCRSGWVDGCKLVIRIVVWVCECVGVRVPGCVCVLRRFILMKRWLLIAGVCVWVWMSLCVCVRQREGGCVCVCVCACMCVCVCFCAASIYTTKNAGCW